MSDLEGYFKKRDLLGGLSKDEQRWVRDNLGIINYVGEGGQLAPLEITHEALLLMVANNQIIVGGRYIITDFRTIYSSEVLSTNGLKIT